VEGEFSRQRLLRGVDLTIVRLFELDWPDLAQCDVQPGVVEPVDPGQGPQLEVVDGADRAFVAHALCLVQADHGLGDGVVIAVADGPIESRRRPRRAARQAKVVMDAEGDMTLQWIG
jgi:hypothetical protein